MPRNQASSGEQPATQSSQRESATRSQKPQTTVLHIRSYDYQWSYDLDVELLTDDGETAFQQRYYVQPGDVESEAGVVPEGDYKLRVTVDNSHEKTLKCQIGHSSAHTAVIEVGNGAFALTEGFQN